MKKSITAAIVAASLPALAAAATAGHDRAAGVERARPEPIRPIAATLSGAAFDDSTGVSSQNPRFVVTFAAPREAELRVGGGFSRVTREPFEGTDTTLAASLSAPWERTRGTFAYALHASSGGARHEVAARLRVDPTPSFTAAVALHHRPFVDVVPALTVDDQLFHEAGPGGASDPRVASRLDVDELRLGASGSPARGTYAYAEVRRLWVDDGNQGWTLSSGAGVNVARALGRRSPVDLSLRWELYGARYDFVAPPYYSPARVVSHGPGAEVRGRIGAKLELAAEGGLTYASDGSEGWYAGALGGVRAGAITVSAHGQVRDDPWYQSRRLWLAVERAF